MECLPSMQIRREHNTQRQCIGERVLKTNRERAEAKQLSDCLPPSGGVPLLRRVDLGAFLLGGPLWRASLA